jgi:hypothetical protein
MRRNTDTMEEEEAGGGLATASGIAAEDLKLHCTARHDVTKSQGNCKE